MTGPIHDLHAQLFKALAHPLRVEVLALLTEGERSVGELIAETGAEASHLSQQLGVLRSAGVLVSRRAGSRVYYRLRDPRTLHLLATAREILATSLMDNESLLADLRQPSRPTKPAPGSGARKAGPKAAGAVARPRGQVGRPSG